MYVCVVLYNTLHVCTYVHTILQILQNSWREKKGGENSKKKKNNNNNNN